MTQHDLLTCDGVTQSIAEWALDYGIPPQLIMARLRKGMRVGRAITKPMKANPGDRLGAPQDSRGVVSDLGGSSGTGAGSAARETPNLEISQ